MASVSALGQSAEDRVATGIEGFDSLVEGGIPRGDLVLLAGYPGSGKTIFAAQYLYNGGSRFGEPGIYVSFAENRAAFLRNMKRTNMDFSELERQGLFKFLDFVTVKERGVDDVLTMVLAEMHSMKAKRLVIDSFSALSQAFSERIDARVILHAVLGKMTRLSGVTTLLITEKPLGSELLGGGMEEFVSDGVVVLSQSNVKGYPRRKLQVIKMRGTKAKRAELTYEIKEHGVIIYPPPEMMPIGTVYNERVETGIEGLDKMLHGGPFKGSIVLVTGGSGTGKSTVAMQFIVRGAQLNEKGLFVSFEDSKEQLVKQGEAFGWKMKELLGRGMLTIASYNPEPGNVEEIFFDIGKLVLKEKPARLVIDSVTALEGLVPIDNTVQYLKGGESSLKALGITTVFTALSDSTGPMPGTDVSTIADIILSLRHVESDSALKRALVFFKARGMPHDTSIREFEVTSKGVVVRGKFAGLERILGGSARTSREDVWQDSFTRKGHDLRQ